MANTKHGHSRSRNGLGSHEYKAWQAMWQRCTNSKYPSFHRYGGRGITVNDRWKDFRLFLEDMGLRPEKHALDRIDNDGNYGPTNCRWATYEDQASNTKSAVWIDFNGELKTISQWARKLGCRPNVISRRLSRGWSIAEALTAPSSTP